MSEKESILDEAKKITSGDRMKQYGHPKDNFEDVAAFWTAHINMLYVNRPNFVILKAKDVAIMMSLFKLAREKSGHKRDNLVDAAGYIRNIAQIEGIE